MNIEEIDPREPMVQEEFCALFEQLPINNEERKNIKEVYWGIYKLCLEHPDVNPATAWLATRNTFIAKEPQVGKRMQEQKENQK